MYKEKKVGKSEELLKSFADQYPEDSLIVQLSLAQLQLSKGNIKEAIGTLSSIKSVKNKPGMVATLVSLYEEIHEIDEAIKVLDEYTAWWGSQQNDEEEYIKLLKENANFKLRHKRFKEAAQMFENVIRLKPNDLEALPGLVISYSQVDPKLAQKYESKLPSLAGTKEVNAESLENLAAPRFGGKAQEAPTEEKPSERKKEKQTKRKKKKHLPKNLVGLPDPERWLPMKDRSSYKKRTSRKGKLEKGGSQGSADRRGIDKSSKAPTTTTQPTTSSAPSQTPPTNANQKETPTSPPTSPKSATQATQQKQEQPKQEQPKQEQKKSSSSNKKKGSRRH